MGHSSSALIDCEDWLRHRLIVTHGIVAACIFGSALTSKTPRDVDLCIVTDAKVGSDEWHRVRKARDSIIEQFRKDFGLPLCVMLVTPSEWREIDGVVVRDRRPLIA
jgi:predicted nucleotidyltransferase